MAPFQARQLPVAEVRPLVAPLVGAAEVLQVVAVPVRMAVVALVLVVVPFFTPPNR